MKHRTLRIRIGATWILLPLLPAWLALATPTWGADPAADASADVESMSLTQLMQLEVTSVSKQPEQLRLAPAAITVLTREDIRRSGSTTIPDLLRLVPGVQVSETSSSVWAIGARGFAGRFARSLLVLVDGRSVYTPSFSGVYWETQDLPLDEIERIEVIRGPGATLWGANAVNGVINIITRRAVDSQGWFATAGGGNQERVVTSARYGIRLGSAAHLRTWGKFFRRSETRGTDGQAMGDQWDFGRAGFRLDWDGTPQRQVSVQGAFHRGQQGLRYSLPTLMAPYLSEMADAPTGLSGAYMVADWQQRFSAASDLTMRVYFDQDRRDDARVFGEDRSTYDVDLQHRFDLHPRLGLIWGGEFRHTNMRLDGSAYFRPQNGTDTRIENLGSGFAQASFDALPGRLELTAGGKLEKKNDLDLAVQPSLRLRWLASSRQTFWGSVSRAVRTPSISERSIDIWIATFPPGSPSHPGPQLPITATMTGSTEFKDEVLVAWEAGYRIQPVDALLLDASVFLMEYKGVRGFETLVPVMEMEPVRHLDLPLAFKNMFDGRSRGLELSSDWDARSWLRVRAWYSFLDLKQTKTNEPAVPGTGVSEFDSSPSHQALIRASVDIGRSWDLDVTGRYVSAVRTLEIPAYTVMDARLAWRPSPPLEVSVTGRNLGPKSHTEFASGSTGVSTVIKPGVFAAIALSF
jgi:iron complex outermembrane receptor protein